MCRILYCIIVFFALLSCSNEKDEKKVSNNKPIHSKNENSVDSGHIENKDSIEQVKKKILNSRVNFQTMDPLFSLQRVKEIKDIPAYDNIPYRRLTQQEFYNAFQQEVDYDAEYERVYYYANQGEWNGFKRYIFIKPDETCCVNFYYNTYDQEGKKIGSFVVASSGGDGGWSISADCNFLNDSTIQQNAIECDMVYIDKKETEECDSYSTVYHLLPDGKFRTETRKKQ